MKEITKIILKIPGYLSKLGYLSPAMDLSKLGYLSPAKDLSKAGYLSPAMDLSKPGYLSPAMNLSKAGLSFTRNEFIKSWVIYHP